MAEPPAAGQGQGAPVPPPPELVIFDLDGTLLDTESLVTEVTRSVLERHGHSLTAEVRSAATGQRPLEAWQTAIDTLGMQGVTAQALFDESEERLRERWAGAQLMPGAARLLRHLHEAGVACSLATSTPRASLQRKLSGRGAAVLQSAFRATHCGDEVARGKPAPDCFVATAEHAGVRPEECLVFEDAPSGVQAASAAGMRVICVPTLTDKEAYPKAVEGCKSGCCAVLPSLFDFQPERFGLPPFRDAVAGVVPVEPPWRLRGPVVKGFGRGSKELGIPTANLDPKALQGALGEAVTGIYCGWASVGADPGVYATAASIGWNPFYSNAEKTVEPWLLHTFDRPFYGEELRLVIVGYIRPEANFTSLEALVARIHEDGDVSKAALSDPRFAAFREDAFLRPLPPPGP